MTIIQPIGSTENGLQPHIFWGEIAPSQHFVQLYSQEGAFLDTLEGFVAGGLIRGEGVIAIATASHLGALATRLRARDLDVDDAIRQHLYQPLDAANTLARFMVNGWPDEERFRALVGDVISRARAGTRRVRAFGEMVAIMWARGETGATVHLEHLWHELCRAEDFSLFCAYPKSGFTQDARESIRQICAAHSTIVS